MMISILHLFIILTSCSLSIEINSHILVIAPPLLSHIIPSLELAKRFSTYCHVTYLISTYKLKELEHKGLLTAFNNSNTLDIIGLNDGNNESIEIELQDFQISINNTARVDPNDRQNALLNSILNRMSSTLNQLFHSNTSISSSSSPCYSLELSSSQSLTTRPITRRINMIIARSITPLPVVNHSIPFYLFLPSNLRGVVSYLHTHPKNSNDSEIKSFNDYLRNNIYHANGFICNSLKEFDEKYVDQFYQLSGKQVPIHFVGPIVIDSQKSAENKAKNIIDWLDTQPVGSVIYVAFGSLIRIPSSVIDTIAKALSPYSFIWSLKSEESLPLSLMNLDPHRQLVLKWTPQRAILAHSSISFFFSHGGWNSFMEGMLNGKAILVWPFFADQFDNAQQLIEMGLARKVSADLQIDIEHMLMNNSYTNKAKQIQKLVIKARDSSSKEQIADIVQFNLNRQKQHNEL